MKIIYTFILALAVNIVHADIIKEVIISDQSAPIEIISDVPINVTLTPGEIIRTVPVSTVAAQIKGFTLTIGSEDELLIERGSILKYVNITVWRMANEFDSELKSVSCSVQVYATFPPPNDQERILLAYLAADEPEKKENSILREARVGLNAFQIATGDLLLPAGSKLSIEPYTGRCFGAVYGTLFEQE